VLRLVLALTLACATSCAGLRVPTAQPVPAAASEAMAAGQAALRTAGEPARERARYEFERAVRAAPDWVAPRRALDEILRDDLRALEALAAYRDALRRGEGDATTLYLAGRLEGREGAQRFQHAARFDPSLAWAWHGIAVSGATEDGVAPRTAALRALDLARDPFERTFFHASVARIDAAAGRMDDAVKRLTARAEDPETAPGDRVALRVQAALLELGAPRLRVIEAGGERALTILRSEETTADETTRLVAALERAIPGPDPSRVALALAARSSPERDSLRARILLEEAPTPLALGLLERGSTGSGRLVPRGSLLRAARFSTGDFRGAVERWLAELPDHVRDENGAPRDARLARVVQAARALEPQPTTDALLSLCTALLDAGWFREARATAARLASTDLDRAVDLDARALAGVATLSGMRRLLSAIDAESRRDSRQPLERDEDDEPVRATPTTPRDIDELLAALAPFAAEFRAFRGASVDLEATVAEFVASPRRSYAGFASVVNPGPMLSAEDERDGLGSAGSEVTGLARFLAEMGRFGIFGELSGDDPDGSVLPVLWIEERAGVHLGVPWHGTVAWCEGADVASRAGRRGARIAGAALHEGYWIDVDEVRHEQDTWESLARRFAASRERVRRALDVRGLETESGDEGRRARVSTSALLDESERVRLAVLADRARDGAVLGSIGLDELVRVSAVHEEGHLCDRTRFLPLSKHWPRALGLAMSQGFSPRAIQEELEYRAQLTALAVVSDPRLPLAQVLDGVEGGFDATPHAAGYARLLGDFLDVLDVRVQAGELPHLAPDRTLAHQLHLLSAEDVRAIALRVARMKHMVED